MSCECQSDTCRAWPVVETVRKLELRPGDILQVALGGHIQDDLPPWIPTSDDLDYCRNEWNQVLPESVQLIVTHHLEEPTIVSSDAESN